MGRAAFYTWHICWTVSWKATSVPGQGRPDFWEAAVPMLDSIMYWSCWCRVIPAVSRPLRRVHSKVDRLPF
ncbi:hypothetical protein B0T18DRAFT_397349 [Schizothecium vesticola]|uniref:Uncharacterized protein n=1 Tax=Schizothecium vesticola TaxID=314040 RepID=A0AA40F9J8_9PEZI|nr:hypothetical protein B0T18DRAFT_397349 [Schizothecium vesticola]